MDIAAAQAYQAQMMKALEIQDEDEVIEAEHLREEHEKEEGGLKR